MLCGAGLYGAVLGVFSIAIGAIVRHTAGGIAGIIAFVLVLAPLTQLIPGSIGDHVYAYLPTSAGQLIPEQSTAAIIVHHKDAKYYSVGESRVEQLMK